MRKASETRGYNSISSHNILMKTSSEITYQDMTKTSFFNNFYLM